MFSGPEDRGKTIVFTQGLLVLKRKGRKERNWISVLRLCVWHGWLHSYLVHWSTQAPPPSRPPVRLSNHIKVAFLRGVTLRRRNKILTWLHCEDNERTGKDPGGVVYPCLGIFFARFGGNNCRRPAVTSGGQCRLVVRGNNRRIINRHSCHQRK